MLINSDCCKHLFAFVSLSNKMRDYKWKFLIPAILCCLKVSSLLLRDGGGARLSWEKTVKVPKIVKWLQDPKSNKGLGLNGRQRQSRYSGIIWCCLSDCETFRELLSNITALSQHYLHPRQTRTHKSCSTEILSFLCPRIGS